jgi:protein NirF
MAQRTMTSPATILGGLVAVLISLFAQGAEAAQSCPKPQSTGGLGVVIERSIGQVAIIDHVKHRVLCHVGGFGDLSHASVVFSPDERFAYVFGRDGGLSKLDLTTGQLVKRVVQSGNAIGGAISQDGRWVAVSNYTPGGVRIFDADTLDMVADLPTATSGDTKGSKTVGLVDAPDNEFLVALYDAGDIWRIRMTDPARPVIDKYPNIGKLPYDALISPQGRFYIAGLFGEDGMAMLDLWETRPKIHRILPEYGKGQKKLPVYKMPHLEGWTFAGEQAFFPAVGEHQVLVADTHSWKLTDRIPVKGQPVFVMARPDARQVWVNFAFPDNAWVQVIDTRTRKIVKTLQPGPGVLHMEFAPRGHEVWISVRDKQEVQVYDTRTFARLATFPMDHPSGIFFTARAHRIGL